MMQVNWQDSKALFFDMDGTLVDSEGNTEIAVRELLTQNNLDTEKLDYHQFHGRTWKNISDLIKESFPELQKLDLPEILQHRFHELFMSPDLPYIDGAPEFLKLCCQTHPVAIVTSSNRNSVEFLVDRLGMADQIRLVLGAEDFAKSKPNPECYLLAASRLGVDPNESMVFEDSQAGLKAARAAGCRSVAVGEIAGQFPNLKELADIHILDYTGLLA